MQAMQSVNSVDLPLLYSADQQPCQLCPNTNSKVLAAHGGRQLLRCSDCGGVFVSPLPQPAEVTAHFQESELDDAALLRKFEKNRENVLAKVASYLHSRQSKGRVLDVGCATGLFLSHFFRGEEWEAWGIDLNPAEVRSAQKKGIRAHLGTLREASFQDAQFDIITVLDALYYFPHPKEELSEIRRLLKSDGLLVIELPLATARIWSTSTAFGKFLKGRTKPLLETSDHLYYFTPQSISCLLKQCGFRIDSIHRLPGNRQETLPRRLAFAAYSFVSKFLEQISRGAIFLGPRFFVVASMER
jgi:2-polyprenyl-3-methyl-5-hydroxy-6-metoxy-1,4-benzoquinol methylase